MASLNKALIMFHLLLLSRRLSLPPLCPDALCWGLLTRRWRVMVDPGSVSHKFFVTQDFHTLLHQKAALRMYNDLHRCYSMCMQQVAIRLARGKFQGSDWSNYGVFAVDDLQSPIPKKVATVFFEKKLVENISKFIAVRISSCNIPFKSFLFESYSKFVEKKLKFTAVRSSSFNILFRTFLFECNLKYTLSCLGLDGYLEDLNGQTLSLGQKISVFKGYDGVARIMLGPASFINHSFLPNGKFECGGATELIVLVYTLRDIYDGERWNTIQIHSGRTIQTATVLPVFRKKIASPWSGCWRYHLFSG